MQIPRIKVEFAKTLCTSEYVNIKYLRIFVDILWIGKYYFIQYVKIAGVINNDSATYHSLSLHSE